MNPSPNRLIPHVPLEGTPIRVYETEDNFSDPESDLESDVESVSSASDVEDDHLATTERRLENNQRFLNAEVSGWTLEPRSASTPPSGDTIQLIRKPTASKMSHRLLNPFIYRNLQDVGTFDDLATLLDSPSNWIERYLNLVASNPIIQNFFSRFRRLPDDASEANVQSMFICLVAQIAVVLGVDFGVGSETKIVVGGILARMEYDLRSCTDPNFFDPDTKRRLLGTEVKTALTFTDRDMWHHKSRGIQSISAMYSFNCPVLLLTQKIWKLIVENRDRNAIIHSERQLNTTLAKPDLGTCSPSI